MAENKKYEKLQKAYNHFKGVILRWENALSKNEGRKPDKVKTNNCKYH